MNNDLTLSVTLTGDGRQLNGTLRNARGEVREFGDVSVRDNARATGAFDRTGRSVGTVNNQLTEMNRVGQAARNALLAIGGAIGVREVIGYSDAWTNAKNQLRQVTRTSAELASVQGKLVDIALETRSSFDASANLYARLARSTTELNLTQEDLLGLTTSINQSFATNGATAEEAAAAITQLSQGLAAGALRGDEFNSVSEQAPGIMRAIAESLSMTIGELREFAAQGGITAEIVVNALQRASDSISQDFAKTTATFGQNLEIARTKLVEWVGTSEGVSTAVDTLGGSIVTVSGHLDELVTVAQVGAGLFAGRYTAAVIAATSATVARTAATVADARAESAAAQALTRRTGAEVQSAKAMLSTARLEVAATQGTNAHTFALGQLSAARVRAATAAGAHNTATTAATAAMGRASVVARGLGGAMALVGGPIGLLVGVGGLLYVFREELGLTGQNLGRTEDELADLRQEMAEMSEQDLSRSLDSLNSALDTATLKTARTRQELASLRDENRGSGVLGFGAGEIGKEVRGIQAVAEAQADLRDIEEQRDTARMERVMRVGEEIGGYKTLDQWNQELEGSTQGVATATEVATTATVKATQASDDATKAAQQQADALEQLRRQLDPAYAASQKLVKSTSILDAGLKSGALTLGEYTDLWGKAADQFINAGNESGTAVDTINDNTDEMGVLWENTLERMDDAGVDMWRSFLDGSEDAFSSFKRLAINTLAEVIHQYTTRQITASFGINAQGEPGGAMSQQGGFSLDSINPNTLKKGWDTVSGWWGGGSGAATAAQGYGGAGWAGSATSGGGWYGSATASGATSAGGSFASGAMGGLYTAGAGLAGGYVGTELGGAFTDKQANSNYGATGGAAIGAYVGSIVPVIGTYLGAALGGALGGLGDTLFGSYTPFKGRFGTVSQDEFEQSEDSGDYVFEHQSPKGQERDGTFFAESKLGVSGFRDSGTERLQKAGTGDKKWAEQLATATAQADNMIASLAAGEPELKAMQEAVQGLEASSSGAGDIIEFALVDRPLAAVEAAGYDIGQTLESAITDSASADAANDLFRSLSLENLGDDLGGGIEADIETALSDVTGASLDGILSSLEQNVVAFQALSPVVDKLNLDFDDMARGALSASGEIAEMSGGAENLAAMQSAYYDSYYSATEKAANSFSDVYDALSDVTDEVPESTSGLRDLIEAQDLNTEAGREAYAQLLQLAPAWSQVSGSLEDVFTSIYKDILGRKPDDGGLTYWIDQVESGTISLSDAMREIQGSAEAASVSADDAADSIADSAKAMRERESLEQELLRLQGDTAAMRQLELEGLDPSNRALQTRIWNIEYEKEAQNIANRVQQERIRALEQEARAMMSAGQSIRQFVEGLQNTSGSSVSPEAAYKNSEESFLAAISTIYTSDDGDLVQETIRGITGIADQYLTAAEDYGASGSIYQQAQALVEGSLDDLADRLGSDEITEIDPQLQAMVDQLKDVAANTGLAGPLAKQVPLAQTFSEFFGGNGSQNYMYRQLGALAGIEAAIRETVAKDVEESTPEGRNLSVSQAASALRGSGNSQLASLFSSSKSTSQHAGNLEYNLGGLLNGESRGLVDTVNASTIANALDFDESRYFSLNEDVAAAVARGEFASGLQHFVSHGLQEGRKFYDGGYTGDGGKYDLAGIVHAGEIVWSQEDISRFGGAGAVESLRTAPRQVSTPSTPLPQFPTLGQSDVVELLQDLRREMAELRKENARLQDASNKHLAAANTQRGAAATQQIDAIERSNKYLKRMEDDKRLEAAKQ